MEDSLEGKKPFGLEGFDLVLVGEKVLFHGGQSLLHLLHFRLLLLELSLDVGADAARQLCLELQRVQLGLELLDRVWQLFGARFETTRQQMRNE